MALVPMAVDAAAPLPVLATGGIADGRDLAAALALGALGGRTNLDEKTATDGEAQVAPPDRRNVAFGSVSELPWCPRWPLRIPERTSGGLILDRLRALTG
jgi:nitronate monooxygenase